MRTDVQLGKTLQHRSLSITEFPERTEVHAVAPVSRNTPRMASQRRHGDGSCPLQLHQTAARSRPQCHSEYLRRMPD